MSTPARRTLPLLTLPFALAACRPAAEPASAREMNERVAHTACDTTPSGESAATAASATATTEPAREAMLPPATIVLGEASPAPGAPPTVRIASPASGAHVAPDASASLDVTGWPTAEGAAHVHLILDNQPYKPIYDTRAPVPMRDLNGGKELAPGPHVLVAFASRANHESVKVPSAIAVAPFVVGESPTSAPAPGSFLVFSRPKGAYAGAQANHVLVDFQLVDVTLGAGKHSVAIEVRGEKLPEPLRARATAFGPPFYLENLPSGTYTLTLTLLDAAGAPVEGAWNKTTRTITVDRSKK